MNPKEGGATAVSPVTVVIPTYNRAADLVRAIGSLGVQDAGPIKVVVVDNSSTDGTTELIASLAPAWQGRLAYIRKQPEGPAAARQAGLGAVTTPFVMFIDSDVELPPEWVGRALAHLGADPGLGAVGGYILYAFDRTKVNAFGGDLGLTGLAWDVEEGTDLDPARPGSDRIWINCSAMICRTAALREAGGFDDTFFYGYEDSDIGWRLNLMGHRVAVFPDLHALHHVAWETGVSNPIIVFHYCKNRLRMILKNASAARLPGMLGAYGAYTLADLVLRGPRGAKLRALHWNLRHLRDTLVLRRAVQRGRKVGDGAVLSKGSGRWFPPTILGGRRRRPVAAPVSHGDAPSAARSAVDDRV